METEEANKIMKSVIKLQKQFYRTRKSFYQWQCNRKNRKIKIKNE
jgi:hypothetical protein